MALVFPKTCSKQGFILLLGTGRIQTDLFLLLSLSQRVDLGGRHLLSGDHEGNLRYLHEASIIMFATPQHRADNPCPCKYPRPMQIALTPASPSIPTFEPTKKKIGVGLEIQIEGREGQKNKKEARTAGWNTKRRMRTDRRGRHGRRQG